MVVDVLGFYKIELLAMESFRAGVEGVWKILEDTKENIIKVSHEQDAERILKMNLDEFIDYLYEMTALLDDEAEEETIH